MLISLKTGSDKCTFVAPIAFTASTERQPPQAAHSEPSGKLEALLYGIAGAFFLNCTAIPYITSLVPMDTTTVNKFRDGLKSFIDQVVTNHLPLRVTRRNGADFVVVSAEDWERDQETLYVLQNSSLMRQIADSGTTHAAGTGYKPTRKQVNEILGVRG
jgi:antitoxin YefM